MRRHREFRSFGAQVLACGRVLVAMSEVEWTQAAARVGGRLQSTEFVDCREPPAGAARDHALPGGSRLVVAILF